MCLNDLRILGFIFLLFGALVHIVLFSFYLVKWCTLT